MLRESATTHAQTHAHPIMARVSCSLFPPHVHVAASRQHGAALLLAPTWPVEHPLHLRWMKLCAFSSCSWCGHCKKLDPIYKKLAKRFKSVSSVVVAKMDGTENEHPDIEVKGFPTILFYPAGEAPIGP